MSKRKTLQDLTIKNSFMFAAVMMDPKNSKPLLEMVLGIEIERIEVSREKSIIYNPEYKGVRLDVFAKDENNTHYNIEMQIYRDNILRRTRYYHSQMDMELLLSGTTYEDLPDSYVIFICDFDPFQMGKYQYTQTSIFKEIPEYAVDDGCHSIYLSTCGQNPGDVPEKLVKFLKFIGAKLSESTADFDDEYIKQLQNAVKEVKASREMENNYMLLEEMLCDEFRAGKAEGKAEGKEEGKAEGKVEGKTEDILEILFEIGSVPSGLQEKITSIENLDVLKNLVRLAAKVSSIEQFEKEMENYQR